MLGNEIAQLKKQLENLETERADAQNEIDNSKKQVYTKMLDLGKMLMAIDNLYQRCKGSDIKLRNDIDDEANNKTVVKGIPKFRISKKPNHSDKHTGGSKDQPTEDDQETYLSKAKKAIEKLRLIKQYVESFNKIIIKCEDEGTTKRRAR